MGHPVQYLFDWEDGTNSGWLPAGTASASKTWMVTGTYIVRAQARCATHLLVVSRWSEPLAVNITTSAIGSFEDVSLNHPFLAYVEAIAAAGITSGCQADDTLTPQNEARFCPEENATRDQTASFIVRAFDGVDATVCTGTVLKM